MIATCILSSFPPPQGKATEALRDRDVKLAKEQDCYIVSPHWITAVSLFLSTFVHSKAFRIIFLVLNHLQTNE